MDNLCGQVKEMLRKVEKNTQAVEKLNKILFMEHLNAQIVSSTRGKGKNANVPKSAKSIQARKN